MLVASIEQMVTRGPVRRLAVLLFCVVAPAVVLGACSTPSAKIPSAGPPFGATSPVAVQRVQSAAAATLHMSARVSYELVGSTGSPSGAQVPVVGSGNFSMGAGTGYLTLVQPSGDEKLVVTPGANFYHPPSVVIANLTGRHYWLAFPTVDDDSPNYSAAPLLTQMADVDPVVALEDLEWGTVSSRPGRIHDIGGDRARGYRVTIDLGTVKGEATVHKALSTVSAVQAQLEEVANATQYLGPTNAEMPSTALFTMEAWVDPAGRVVEIVASPPGSGAGITAMELSSFGEKVDVRIPSKHIAPFSIETAGAGDAD